MKKIKLIGILIIGVVILLASCKKDDPLSDVTGLTSFKFKQDEKIPGLENIKFSIDQTSLIIENKDSLPYDSNVSSLIAIFEAIEKTIVKVRETDQVSGETTNNFTESVVYKVTAEDGVTTKNYTVKVNVSKINPEAVNWAKQTAALSEYDYDMIKSVWFNGKILTILGKIDSKNKIAGAEYLYSSDGAKWDKVELQGKEFPLGIFHGLTVFDNKVYILGTYGITSPWGFPMPGSVAEIWKSSDGIDFTKLENKFTFDGDKINSALFSFDGTLWVVGGNKLGFGNYNGGKSAGNDFASPAGLSKRVHSTTDFVSWTEGESDTIVNAVLRRNSANVVHKNKMYMIGGQGADGKLLNDVWRSADGKNWEKVSEGAFNARMEAVAVSYDEKIWLIGGHLSLGKASKEILVSEDDGATWQTEGEVKLPEDFAERAGHAAFIDSENNIWITGGYTPSIETGTDGKQKETKTMLYDVWKGKLNKLNN